MDESLRNISKSYEIAGELGRGTTGTVYEAWDTKLNRRVAIKVPDLLPESESLLKSRRFMRECRILAGLTGGPDCNIPKLHAVSVAEVHPGQPFNVQEFMEGKTLEQRVAEDSIDLRTGLSIIADIARVVQFVHERGIAHRDLSPDNVLVAQDGTPWLVGFSRARAIDDMLMSQGAEAAPVQTDVQGLLALLRWLCAELGHTVPNGLESPTATGSPWTAGAFAEALSRHLEVD